MLSSPSQYEISVSEGNHKRSLEKSCRNFSVSLKTILNELDRLLNDGVEIQRQVYSERLDGLEVLLRELKERAEVQSLEGPSIIKEKIADLAAEGLEVVLEERFLDAREKSEVDKCT